MVYVGARATGLHGQGLQLGPRQQIQVVDERKMF